MTKKVSVLLIVALVAISTIPVSASTPDTDPRKRTASAGVIITIEDPVSKLSDTWEIDSNDIKVESNEERFRVDNSEESLNSLSAEIDITPYLGRSFAKGNPSGSTTLKDNITIKTGLTYSANVKKNTVRLYKCFGSTVNKGMYYASNRRVNYSNPGAYGNKVFYPSSNSWNKSVNSSAGFYSSNLPPFSTLCCRVNVSGMSSYRIIYVTFKLEL